MMKLLVVMIIALSVGAQTVVSSASATASAISSTSTSTPAVGFPKKMKLAPKTLPKPLYVKKPKEPKAKKMPKIVIMKEEPSPAPIVIATPSPIAIATPSPILEATPVPEVAPEVAEVPEVEKCTDVPPDAEYTCAEQASCGRCNARFLRGFCVCSCA
eukprot:TRINITY_DN2216_c0_g1_i11.p2 TRINITY_DN2216_c0_g1~~TRINITY_DN2216_c0_g1_i11.p2  ORF type:complete len:158 (-),score=38.88 TRINITY_DN2216_c0_g1_i11:4-477(-)